MSDLITIDPVTAAKLLARHLTPAKEFNKAGQELKFRGHVYDATEPKYFKLAYLNHTCFYAISVRDADGRTLKLIINSEMGPTNEARMRGVHKNDYVELDYIPCSGRDDLHVRCGMPALPLVERFNIIAPAELISTSDEQKLFQGVVKDIENLPYHERWDFSRSITLQDTASNIGRFTYGSYTSLPPVKIGDHVVMAARANQIIGIKSYPL